MRGKLQVITGCMFAGKSTWLIRLARHKVGLNFKHSFDTRYEDGNLDQDQTYITTHAGDKMIALAATSSDHMASMISSSVTDVYIDEGQFFDENILYLVEELLERGCNVTIAGLDYDSAGDRFGYMLDLYHRSDVAIRLCAKCYLCSGQARHTKRLVCDTAQVLVGGADMYQPICSDCLKSSEI